ncbi:MAG: DoxX family protein [Pseudomonadota bacterium]|nr:DoxX family protein [Pseudomonadota bacterium]
MSIVQLYKTQADDFQANLSLFIFLSITMSNIIGMKTKKLIKQVSVLFMFTLFTGLTALTIAIKTNQATIQTLIGISLAIKIMIYYCIAKEDIQSNIKTHQKREKKLDWHVLTVRVMIGCVFIPHFCEKLFTGETFRQVDVLAFTELGVPMPYLVVIIAGLCEFFGSIAITCGFLTRLSALCTALYLIIATYLGGHFSAGYIWVSEGGGWEYPVLWFALILCFAVFGPGYFSIDQHINKTYKLPKFIKWLTNV